MSALQSARWLTHQPKKTLLERRGGHPEHLLEETDNLSDREVPKKAIADRVEQRHQRRLQNREPKKQDNCTRLTTDIKSQ